MNPNKWVGLGFCATSENAHPDQYKQWGPVQVVAPQICWGQRYPDIDPNLTHAKRVIQDCRNCGLTPAGWAWCNGPNASAADAEARYHAKTALELGLTLFVANMEAPYDAGGNSSDPRYTMGNTYAAAFRQVASEAQVELGLTTTPRWASDGTGMRNAGAVIMPQCFTGEVTDGSAEINAAVPFMVSWGWTVDRQRPLVQTYATNGVYPDPGVYNDQSFTQSVGVVPYILEQADPDGIKTMAPSISRLPAAGPPPIPPDPDDGGDRPIDGGGPPPLDLPFKRALYPPDAVSKGKTPSTDGPDVIAVKRAISRAGYWRWQQFDDTYSNGFSHGNSSSGPGVQGFQAYHVAAQPTGWYGQKTHDTLVNFLIPQGRAHAGEWAFDQTAVNLYKQA
jgi:hypothetical protein